MITSTATLKQISTQASAYWELTKPGINLMVMISMMIGFFMGSSLMQSFDWLLFLQVSIGTFLISAGTAAHNQYLERDLDKLMSRTKKRPLPSQKISRINSFIFSMSLIFGGFIYLLFNVNFVAAAVSAATSIIYLGAYTPLKRISFANVFVGAIPGALPPVGGWAAATGSISHEAVWLLFGIAFFWQVAHVVAIAWLCKDDYGNAGFKMLPKDEYASPLNKIILLLSLGVLIPIGLSFTFLGISTWIFGTLATLIGGYYLWNGIEFIRKLDKDSARKMLFGSLFYLPIVWLALFLDRLIGGWVL